MSDLEKLIEMGFPEDKAEYAMKVTNNKGVEPAMEWLLAHEGDEIPLHTAGVKEEDTIAEIEPTLQNKVERNLVQKQEEERTDTSINCEELIVSKTKDGELKGNMKEEQKEVTGISADNDDNDNEDEEKDKEQSSISSPDEKEGNNAVVTSYVCDDCKKICYSEVKMEYHFMKTGHSNFSESAEEKKPLTEEERKRQLALIEERLKQNRIEREEREKIEAIERERNRIRSGKDLTEARKRLEEIEMKKIVEQRKREKAEEKTARERVRAQIESDKARRRLQQSKGSTENNEAIPSTINSKSEEQKPVTANNKQYSKTRIQIRLHDGTTISETFGIKEQLSAVRLFVQIKTESQMTFGLMTTFPRKVFTDEDYNKSLDVLGLVPSAVLYMTKSEVSAEDSDQLKDQIFY